MRVFLEASNGSNECVLGDNYMVQMRVLLEANTWFK